MRNLSSNLTTASGYYQSSLSTENLAIELIEYYKNDNETRREKIQQKDIDQIAICAKTSDSILSDVQRCIDMNINEDSGIVLMHYAEGLSKISVIDTMPNTTVLKSNLDSKTKDNPEELATKLAIIAASTPNNSGYYDLLVLLLGDEHFHYYLQEEQEKCIAGTKEYMDHINIMTNELIGQAICKISIESLKQYYEDCINVLNKIYHIKSKYELELEKVEENCCIKLKQDINDYLEQKCFEEYVFEGKMDKATSIKKYQEIWVNKLKLARPILANMETINKTKLEIQKLICDFKNAINAVEITINLLITEIRKRQDKILIASILSKSTHKFSHGIPTENKYYEEITTSKQLEELTRKVNYDVTLTSTGDTLALLAIKSNNWKIYDFLISRYDDNGRSTGLHKPNRKGLNLKKIIQIANRKTESCVLRNDSFENALDVALLEKFPQFVDRTNLLLESCERYLRSYMIRWRDNTEEKKYIRDNNKFKFYLNIIIEQIYIEHHEHQYDEAMGYLVIIQKALSGEIAGFCNKIKDILNHSIRGRFINDELNITMEKLIALINKSEHYSYIRNSEMILLEKLNCTEQKIIDLKKIYTTQFQRQYIEHAEELARKTLDLKILLEIQNKSLIKDTINLNLDEKLDKTLLANIIRNSYFSTSNWPWYTDGDITTLIDIKINRKQYNKQNCNFLLLGGNEGRYTDEDNNTYFVVITPAIDTLSYASSLDFYLDKSKQQAPDAGKKDDRRDVFDELLVHIRRPGELHIKILFPYNMIQSHWLTGEIKIHRYLKNNLNQYFIEVSAHDPMGGGAVIEENYNILCSTIKRRILQIDPGANAAFNSCESQYGRRQHIDDGDSCGAIVVEDIYLRANGTSLNRSSIYSKGAINIRNEHIELIKKLDINDATRKYFLKRHDLNNFYSEIASKINTSDISKNDKQNLLIEEFMHASFRGNIKLLELLLTQVDVNTKDILGATALHWAAGNNQHEVVKLLLKAKANSLIADTKGQLPLNWTTEDNESANLLRSDMSKHNNDNNSNLVINKKNDINDNSSIYSEGRLGQVSINEDMLTECRKYLQNLLKEGYKFNITRPNITKLQIQYTEIDSTLDTPEDVRIRLTNLSKKLLVSFKKLNIKCNCRPDWKNYKLFIEPEDANNWSDLNNAASTLENLGIGNFNKLNQYRSIIFFPQSSAEINPVQSEEIHISCKMQ